MVVEMSHPSELRKVYEGAGTKSTKLSAHISRDCYGAPKEAEGVEGMEGGKVCDLDSERQLICRTKRRRKEETIDMPDKACREWKRSVRESE